MTTIITAYGQKINLSITANGNYVLTLMDTDGATLAQIGMEPHEYFELIEEVSR